MLIDICRYSLPENAASILAALVSCFGIKFIGYNCAGGGFQLSIRDKDGYGVFIGTLPDRMFHGVTEDSPEACLLKTVDYLVNPQHVEEGSQDAGSGTCCSSILLPPFKTATQLQMKLKLKT